MPLRPCRLSLEVGYIFIARLQSVFVQLKYKAVSRGGDISLGGGTLNASFMSYRVFPSKYLFNLLPWEVPKCIPSSNQ